MIAHVLCSLAGRIAQICREEHVPRLIHVSHLNASANSSSAFYRTKYLGELLVRKEFPEATIVRPGPMYGYDDGLLYDMAGGCLTLYNSIFKIRLSKTDRGYAVWPMKYALNGQKTKIIPAHVVDVADALSTMLNAPVTSTASTFVLPGPEVFTYEEMLNLISYFTMRRKPFLPPTPKFVASIFASLLNRFLWFPTFSPDEVQRRFIDDSGAALDMFVSALNKQQYPKGWEPNVNTNQYGVNGEVAKSWANLDIEPSRLQEHAIKYLRGFRAS